MSFRAGSLGFGDTLPLAEGRGKCENQLLRSPSWGRGWGEDAWERGRPPAARLPSWACTATPGPLRGAGASSRCRGPARSLSRRQIPLSLRAYSLLPHKGQKGTGEEIGSWSQGSKAMALQRGKVVERVRSWALGATKQLLPQTPIKAQGGCAEKAGASHGKRVSSAPSSGISRPVKEGNKGEAQGRWRGPTGHGFREVGQGVMAGYLRKAGRPSERPCPNRTIRSPPPSLQL